MNTHTPGPWHGGTFRTLGICPGVDIAAANGSNVALVYHDEADQTEGETKANARLIASSPDLLAALQALLRRCATLDQSSTYDGLENCQTMAQARAAIARAIGAV